MIDILLAAINAKYIHSALGQRCIQANLGSLKDRSDLVEFDIRRRASEIAEQIISRAPRILSFGVYVWNVEIVTEVVQLIRAVAPEIILLLGGPEVSFPDDLPPVADLADYVICGEGEITYRKLCEQLLDGQRPAQKIIPQELSDLSCLELPYSLYREEDILNRVLYIETSRGCPFGCEF
ncbi:MAG: cobalamin-dependent protein, partial [Verrucomicrobia bacterium]|nr:cobalamin-dependent protein [Verrucomicrobiota bacterium]